jgi:hypothetical protein
VNLAGLLDKQNAFSCLTQLQASDADRLLLYRAEVHNYVADE